MILTCLTWNLLRQCTDLSRGEFRSMIVGYILNIKKKLYSETVENFIIFYIETNRENENVGVKNVVVDYCLTVWNEHGTQLHEVTNTWDTSWGFGCGFEVKNIPEDDTHVTSILEIKNWNAIPIRRARG